MKNLQVKYEHFKLIYKASFSRNEIILFDGNTCMVRFFLNYSQGISIGLYQNFLIFSLNYSPELANIKEIITFFFAIYGMFLNYTKANGSANLPGIFKDFFLNG